MTKSEIIEWISSRSKLYSDEYNILRDKWDDLRSETATVEQRLSYLREKIALMEDMEYEIKDICDDG